MKPRRVHQTHIMLLLAAAVGCIQVQDRAMLLSNERNTIERTYELTKYLDHQLKEIKDTYLSYLGPPFSEPGFSPPRPNISSLAVPSAATRVDLWRGLENGARLAQNQRAYSVLLCAVRELARSTLCPYLQSSLLHFCSGLSGLLGSISGLMNALGYTPPLHGNAPHSQKYAPPLMSSYQRSNVNSPAPLRRSGQSSWSTVGTREGTTGSESERKRDRERERAERGRRGRRKDGESWAEREEEDREDGLERWGRRRRLLSFEDEQDGKQTRHKQNSNNNNNVNNTHVHSRNYFSKYSKDKQTKMNSTEAQTGRRGSPEEDEEAFQQGVPVLFSSSLHPGRSGRPLSSAHPPLSPLSLLYAYEDGAVESNIHFTTAAPSSQPALNDFTRKVEGFWILRELQSWLWRSAKDFTRLKKRLRV